jgi:hypothetical protein
MVALEIADCIVVLLVLVAASKPARELKKLRPAKLRLLCSQKRDQNRDDRIELVAGSGWSVGRLIDRDSWWVGEKERTEADEAGNEAHGRVLVPIGDRHSISPVAARLDLCPSPDPMKRLEEFSPPTASRPRAIPSPSVTRSIMDIILESCLIEHITLLIRLHRHHRGQIVKLLLFISYSWSFRVLVLPSQSTALYTVFVVLDHVFYAGVLHLFFGARHNRFKDREACHRCPPPLLLLATRLPTMHREEPSLQLVLPVLSNLHRSTINTASRST